MTDQDRHPDAHEPRPAASAPDRDQDRVLAEAGIEPAAPAPPPQDPSQDPDALDPANRSLADALRVSFVVLKVVMLFLLVLYLFSNTRNVDEGRLAIRLIFGAIKGDPGAQVLEPGGPYWHWPEPIGRFIEVDTTTRRLEIDRAFWFETRPGEEFIPERAARARGGLRPGADGSLLTGDQNIVHGRWAVNYRVLKPDAATFIRNVSADPDPRRMMNQADRVVRSVAERAILHAVAQVSADQFIRSGINRERIMRMIQDGLDEMDTGITITQVLLEAPSAPLNVQDAFRSVSEAESDKAQKIAEARKEATAILTGVAGERHGELIAAIDHYEQARRLDDPDAIASAEQTIQELLRPEVVQGRVSEIIRGAQLYKTTVESAIRTEAERFQQLLPAYRRNPQIVIDRLWQDTRRRILSGDVETFYLPSNADKQLYLEFNRDPRVQKQRETRRYQQQTEQLQQQSDLSIEERMRQRRERERRFREDQLMQRPEN